MEETGFCVRCKKIQKMNNVFMDKTSKGVSMLRGTCFYCNTKMTKMVGKDFDTEKNNIKDDKDKDKKGKENKIEDWNKYFEPYGFELIKKSKKGKGSPYMKFILIFLGLLFLSGALFWNGYYDKFKSDIDCGNETINNNCVCPECPENPCNNDCNLVCPNITFPDSLDLNIVNGSG